MESVNRIKYRADLNRVRAGKREALFLDGNAMRVIHRCLDVLIKGITTEDGQESAEICACFADSSHLHKVIESPPWDAWLSLIVFPNSGRVSYKLNPNEFFMSNIHQNPDLVIVQRIETGIHLHPTRTEEELWMSGSMHNPRYFPNRIKGALLFRENPTLNLKKYDWFKDYLDLKSTP